MLSQLIGRTRWRESDVAHVVVEIEGCVLDPVRPVQFESPGVLGGFQRSSAINPTLFRKNGGVSPAISRQVRSLASRFEVMATTLSGRTIMIRVLASTEVLGHGVGPSDW